MNTSTKKSINEKDIMNNFQEKVKSHATREMKKEAKQIIEEKNE